MHIGNVSFLAPSSPLLNPAVANSTPVSRATTALPEVGKSKGVPGDSNTAIESPAAAAVAIRSERTRGAGGQAAAATAPTAADGVTSVIAYSTSVGGKQYPGSVEQAGNEYTASIPSVALATATGTSLDAAEYNLDVRIDELV